MEDRQNATFYEKCSNRIDVFVHSVYDLALSFPREELYSSTDQLKRSALSVALNYTEGYARQNKKEFAYFVRIAYGSLKEAVYVIEFAQKRGWVPRSKAVVVKNLSHEIGRLLWTTLVHMR